LYGVTGDGACICGTLFSLTPPATGAGLWPQNTLHTFTGGSDGGNVNGGLLISPSGVIYGTTQLGGSTNVGTVFSYALAVPQPAIAGVVNAADYQAPVAPGSIAAAFGDFFLPAAVSAVGLPLPDNILDLSFEFNRNLPTPLIFASSGQVNFQIPWELEAAAPATLTASLYNQTSAAQSVALAKFAPAIFSANSQGTGQGAILYQSYRLVDAS